MREDTITALPDPNGFSADPLTDLIRSCARQLIEQALEAELIALFAQFSNETMRDGTASPITIQKVAARRSSEDAVQVSREGQALQGRLQGLGG